MAAPMASPIRMQSPYLRYRDFFGSCELIARRISLASALPSFHAAFPAVLLAAGATRAPTFAPALVALLFLRAIRYLHLRGVGFSKQRDTLKGPFGNSTGITAIAPFEASESNLSVPAQLGDQSEPPVAHPPLVQRLLELGLPGETDLPGGRGLHEGGQVFSLRGREARGVVLPFEEPHPPGERDEDAAWLGAGDLPFSPVHRKRRVLVHVPEGLLEAHRIIAAGTGGVEHPPIREPLNPLVDPTLPRRVLPEGREMEPPLPVKVPVDDAGGIEVVHGDNESVRVGYPELPAAPQVRGALQRPVLPALGELGDLSRNARVFADF